MEISSLRIYEKTVISTILYEIGLGDASGKNVWQEISELKPEHFYFPENKIIFDTILRLRTEGIIADDNLLMTKEKRITQQMILDIISIMPIANIAPYANIITEEYVKRTVRQTALETISAVDAGSMSSDELKSYAIGKLGSIENATRYKAKKVGDLREVFATQPKLEFIKTGFNFIDTCLGNRGIEYGQFMFVSGKKESGKTFLSTWILENIAENGIKCCFFSLEFGSKQYVKNLDNKYRIPNNKRKKAIEDNIFLIDDKSDILDIENILYDLSQNHGVKFVLIDSMMRIQNNFKKFGSLEEAKSDWFGRLGQLARKLEIVIVLVVQIAKKDYADGEVSVKGSVNADHEASIWLHIEKEKKGELRNFTFVKNKQTFKRGHALVEFCTDLHKPFKTIKASDNFGDSLPTSTTEFKEEEDDDIYEREINVQEFEMVDIY